MLNFTKKKLSSHFFWFLKKFIKREKFSKYEYEAKYETLMSFKKRADLRTAFWVSPESKGTQQMTYSQTLSEFVRGGNVNAVKGTLKTRKKYSIAVTILQEETGECAGIVKMHQLSVEDVINFLENTRMITLALWKKN